MYLLINAIFVFILKHHFWYRYDIVQYVRLTYEELLQLGPRMSKYQFTKKVICGRKVYSSICLKDTKRVHVKVIHRDKFMVLKLNNNCSYLQHENQEYLFTYQIGSLESNEGILLASIGQYSQTKLEFRIDYKMVKAINSAYQGGYSRERCKKKWSCIYARGTNRPHPRPTIRDEDIAKHQYYNQNSNKSHILRFETESIGKSLGDNAMEFGKLEPQPLFKIIGSSCDMIILTSGLPNYTCIPLFHTNTNHMRKNKKMLLIICMHYT